MKNTEAVEAVMTWLAMAEREGSLPPAIVAALPLFRDWMLKADASIRVLRRIVDVMDEESAKMDPEDWHDPS